MFSKIGWFGIFSYIPSERNTPCPGFFEYSFNCAVNIFRFKPGGRKAYFRAIRCFFNWAYSPASDLGLKPSDNPITWVKAPKVSRKIMPAQSKESIEVLLSYVDNVRDQAIICLLTDSGSRLAGFADISEPDIDWDRHLIKIIIKGGDEAFIPFGRGTEILLREWLSEYNPNGGSIWGINKSGIVSMLRRLESSSGVKCNGHTFRRGFASILRRNNVDSLDIMRLGGWKSLTMVQTYTESVSFDDSLGHYQSPIRRPADATDGLSEKEEVPKPRIELGTRGFSVRQEHLCIEILTHLADIGQAAEELRQTLCTSDQSPTQIPAFIQTLLQDRKHGLNK